jgi:hypothetical protein
MTKDPFADPTTKDSFQPVLEFFRDSLKYTFDISHGDYHGLGRGYMIYNP